MDWFEKVIKTMSDTAKSKHLMELQKDRFYALIFMVIVIAAIVFGGDFLRAIAPNGFF